MRIDDDEPLPQRGRGRVERKAHLDKQKLINCGRCKYHRGENQDHHLPRDDRHKNHRRV